MSRWPTATLSSVAAVFNGKTPSVAEQQAEGVPVLKVKDVDEHADFVGSFDSFVDQQFAARYGNKRIEANDVLILNAAHSADYVGSKIFLANSEVAGAYATGEWMIVRANPRRLCPGFIYRYFQSARGRASVKSLVRGIHLYPSDVERISVPCPPLVDQERIIQILTEGEALRRLRAASDSRLKKLPASLFLAMFGNPLSTSPKWPVRRVSEVCDLVRGSSPRPKGDPRYFGGPVPRLMIEDITRDGWWVTPRVDSLTLEGAKLSRPVKAGTVVMAVSGNIGLCAQLTVDACVHDGFVAFTNLDETQFDRFFFGQAIHLLKELNTRAQAGAIFQNITTTDVKALSVICPPLDMQREFADRVGEIRELESAQLASRTRLDHLFEALLYYAFEGRL